MAVTFINANENMSRCVNACVHGSCEYGACICEVKYSGHSCNDPNLGYYIGFGVVFFLISTISFFQLVFCIYAELKSMSRPRFWKACHLTIQKLLYLYVIVAAGSRGVYYTTEVTLPKQWRIDLFAVYYPFVICCFTTLICFWAEAFHLAGWSADKRQFLKKSSPFLLVFNAFVFTMMIAQLISSKTVTDSNTLMLLADVFSGCFVILMFAVLIFFLIYGIEIFCKVEGAFTGDANVFNLAQLNMSRFGLIAQAVFQLAATVFFLCDVLQKKWKYRTNVNNRNALDLVSRISELAVALWFPCVLWNCISPKELWILNPKNLVRSSPSEEAIHEEETTPITLGKHTCYNSIEDDLIKESRAQLHQCWVCYDMERTDAGSLIFPCKCKGDVAAVHHECLKRWLNEVVEQSDESPRCRVCNELYTIKEEKTLFPKGMKLRQYFSTFFITVSMVAVAVGTYRVCVTDESTLFKVGLVGIALLSEYILFRWLGHSFVSAYQRIKMATIVVLGRQVEVDGSGGPE